MNALTCEDLDRIQEEYEPMPQLLTIADLVKFCHERQVMVSIDGMGKYGTWTMCVSMTKNTKERPIKHNTNILIDDPINKAFNLDDIMNDTINYLFMSIRGFEAENKEYI